jgi:hypothetical protein
MRAVTYSSYTPNDSDLVYGEVPGPGWGLGRCSSRLRARG